MLYVADLFLKHLHTGFLTMALELEHMMVYLFRQSVRLSFSMPDVFLPLNFDSGGDMTKVEANFSEETEYVMDHDGQGTNFRLREDRLLSILGSFRQ